MLQTDIPGYDEARIRLVEIGNAGFTLAFNYTALGAELLDNTVPQAWQESYVRNGIFMHDPVFQWIISHAAEGGYTRWSEVEIPDPMGIMRAAATHGMRFGFSATQLVNNAHSFLSIARSDRELADEEIRWAYANFTYWVDLLYNRASLTDGEIGVLAALRDGLDNRAAAQLLHVSEATIRYRSGQAQEKLKAETRTQAVAIAIRRKFI